MLKLFVASYMQLENTKLLSFSLKHILSMFRLKYESQSFKNDSEHKYPENKKVFLEGGGAQKM